MNTATVKLVNRIGKIVIFFCMGAFIILYLAVHWLPIHILKVANELNSNVIVSGYMTRIHPTAHSSQNYVKDDYLILYYNMPRFIKTFRKYALIYSFETCEWSNCKLTLNKNLANTSSAVIYDGILMPKDLGFKRPNGQVWIFAAHEAPSRLYTVGKKWWHTSKHHFNWTMTYNKNSTDIHLPYGAIIKRDRIQKRNYQSIASCKGNMSLIITSNCGTLSKRMEYVKELSKYINVTILGRCTGREWKCGIFHSHTDECFKIINSYKFYLAFENSFCHQYFTEKYFENFNYDTIMVTRGGLPGDAKKLLPSSSFISSDDFKSAKDLAFYLKGMSLSDYATLLERKDHFFSSGFKKVYQSALCEICYKMNFQEKYRKTIKDINKWVQKEKYCLNPSEINDIV